MLAKYGLLWHLNRLVQVCGTRNQRSKKRYKVPARHCHRQCQLLFFASRVLNGTTQGKHLQSSMTRQHDAGCCIT